MPFFHYHQNNSGGKFIFPAKNVFIEAKNHEEADELAQRHRLYFDGVADGRDCGCCGDRWSRQWPDRGTSVPMMYGRPLTEIDNEFMSNWDERIPFAVVYYTNGKEKIYQDIPIKKKAAHLNPKKKKKAVMA